MTPAVTLLGAGGHGEGVGDEVGAHVVGHRVAEQPAGSEIDHRGQIEPAPPVRMYV